LPQGVKKVNSDLTAGNRIAVSHSAKTAEFLIPHLDWARVVSASMMCRLRLPHQSGNGYAPWLSSRVMSYAAICLSWKTLLRVHAQADDELMA